MSISSACPNLRWFIEALRDACNQALDDGIVGNQMFHIERVEVVSNRTPMDLNVHCFGAYSPTQAEKVHGPIGICETMDLVARYLGDRAIGLKEDFDGLKGGE